MSERIKIPFTNEHFAAWCLSMIGQPYWYGTVIYKCTSSLLRRKTAQYPDHYGAKRTSRYEEDIAAKRVCADCVGGCKGYAWTQAGTGVTETIGTDNTFTNTYGSNGCPDKSANGMFAYAKSKGMEFGSIDTLPDIVGLALHKDGHVGYTVGDGYAVEWKGFSSGCVKTRIAGRGWTHWYKLPFIEYSEDSKATATTDTALGSRLLKKGMTGADVRAMQELLLQLGYELPEHGPDGDFGSETLKALRRFQQAEELEADGLYGSQTHSALMDAVADDDEGKKDDETDDLQPSPGEPTIPHPTGTMVTIVAEGGGHVNIRVGHGTGYKRITTVPSGTTFEYVATAGNGWNAVIVSGQIGWVSGKYSRVSQHE